MFLALLALPLDLDGKQQGLAAVLGLVVVWWISGRGGHDAADRPRRHGQRRRLIIGQAEGEDRPERLRFGRR